MVCFLLSTFTLVYVCYLPPVVYSVFILLSVVYFVSVYSIYVLSFVIVSTLLGVVYCDSVYSIVVYCDSLYSIVW